MSSTPPAGAHAQSESKASSQRGPEPQGTSNKKHASHGKGSDGDSTADEARRSPSPAEDGEYASPVEKADAESGAPPLPQGEEPPPLPVGEEPPPLPVGEDPPPLPNEAPPSDDDGWEALWDDANQAYYFHNKRTGVTQWENPRVPSANSDLPDSEAPAVPSASARPHGGYNPAIHGDYDPNADYAVAARAEEAAAQQAVASANARILRIAGVDAGGGGSSQGTGAPGDEYAAAGMFNRFTGRWQAAEDGPERHNDENKSKRQMNAYFDVDAAANSHGGRSLKAERQNKKLSKAELKAFKEKRREKKEEKRRAWLRD